MHVSKVKQYNQSKREVRGSEQMFEVLSISSRTGTQPSMPLIDGLVDNTLLQSPDQTMWQSGAALSATEQHLSWYSTIERISVSNK